MKSSSKPFSLTWMTESPARVVACGFGSGLLKPAPGTWGTLFAWLVWQYMPISWGGPAWMLFFLLACFVLGCWACSKVGTEVGVHDHGAFVWDEVVAFWFVLWLIPSTFVAQLIAFVLFRAFDIVKPYPIRFFDEKIKNGLGVMLDDLIAAGYTLLIVAILVKFSVL